MDDNPNGAFAGWGMIEMRRYCECCKICYEEDRILRLVL